MSKKLEIAEVAEVAEVVMAIDLDALLEGSKQAGKGIGDFCRKTIVKGLIEQREWISSKEVLAAVKAEFGEGCSTTEKSIAWYKSELRNDKEKLAKVVRSLGYTV